MRSPTTPLVIGARPSPSTVSSAPFSSECDRPPKKRPTSAFYSPSSGGFRWIGSPEKEQHSSSASFHLSSGKRDFLSLRYSSLPSPPSPTLKRGVRSPSSPSKTRGETPGKQEGAEDTRKRKSPLKVASESPPSAAKMRPIPHAHQGPVSGIAFSRNGEWISSLSSESHQLHLWSTDNGSRFRVHYHLPRASVEEGSFTAHFCFSPDHQSIFVPHGQKVFQFGTFSGKQERVLSSHLNSVSGAFFDSLQPVTSILL